MTIGFVAFVELVVGLVLTPAQRVLCMVAFDGVEPGDLTGDERELARKLFGPVDTVSPVAREVVVAVCGARSGKSYVLIALRLLYGALTRCLATLAPGELAAAIIVAPDLRLARQALRFALGAAKSVPSIAACIESEGADGFVIRRPDGRAVSLECLPANRGGSATRGRSLTDAALEESCFMRDADFVVNDSDVFNAVAPRIMRGGQVVIASTPWAEGVGLTSQLFAANFGNPQTALIAHAPTSVMRDDERTRAQVERERLRDPDNARREFDAEFMPAGTDAWFDPSAIDSSSGAELRRVVYPHFGMTRAIGIDLGFKSDSSALVVCQSDGHRISVAEVLELRPQKGAPLVPSEVARAFAEVAFRFRCPMLVADSWCAEPMREHFRDHGLKLHPAPEGLTGKIETYTLARAALHEGRVLLPQHQRLLGQLRAVQRRPTSGGGVSITSPRRGTGGGHGDLVSALVLALWALRRPSGGRNYVSYEDRARGLA